MRRSINELIVEKITGEWGDEPVKDEGVNVLRTTNFTNMGTIDYYKLVKREVDKSKVQKKHLIKGDIIIEKSGGSPNQPVGRVVFFDLNTDEKFLCNNFTAILRPNRDLVDPKYFFYQLFIAHQRGRTLKYQHKTTGIINLQLDRYLKESIEVPPILTQLKIASLLTKTENLIAQRKESIRLLDEYLKSAFLEMFGDPGSNNMYWNKLTLKELSLRFSDGPFGSNLKTEHYSDNGIQVVRLQNIGINNFIEEAVSFVTNEHYDRFLKKYSCFPGDVIIATMGSPNIRACIIPSHVKISVNKADCILLRVNPRLTNQYYLSHLLNLEGFLFMATSFFHGQTRSRISSGQLSKIPIPIPPIELQTCFAQIVEKTETLKSKYRQSLQELENLYGSLSQRAFRGELTTDAFN